MSRNWVAFLRGLCIGLFANIVTDTLPAALAVLVVLNVLDMVPRSQDMR